MITVLSNSTISATIKHLGAELISLKNTLNKEYIWEGNPVFWGKHSPVLFPIVGALQNDTYSYKDKEHSLSRHGFAREMEFKLVSSSSESATFSIESNLKTLEVFPFQFEFQIIYTLTASKIKIAYKVINRNDSELFFSVGAHPAIALSENFENYAIAFEKPEILNHYLLENNLISNKTKQIDVTTNPLDLNYELFKNDALIFKQLASKSITILEDERPYVKVSYNDFPSLGIWTVDKAPFICIEPWLGYADTINNSGQLDKKEGIIKLNSRATFLAQFSIEIL